jgi:hypothetical protein
VPTWDDVHVGDAVLGYDNREYWVSAAWHTDPRGPVVTLVNNVTGAVVGPAQPPPGTAVVILRRADVSAETAARAMFASVGLETDLIGEMYQP